MIIKTLFFLSIFTIPIFGLISPFSSGFQLKNHPLNKPLTINFPKRPTNDCATQNRQLKEFAKEIFKKLGIIVKTSLANYETPKRNYPKNAKIKREMFQKSKHLLTETKNRKFVDCATQNHQLKEFARELLKGFVIIVRALLNKKPKPTSSSIKQRKFPGKFLSHVEKFFPNYFLRK